MTVRTTNFSYEDKKDIEKSGKLLYNCTVKNTF